MQQIFSEPEQKEKSFAERMLGRRLTGEFKKLTDRMGKDSLYFIGHNYREFFRILSREEVPIFEKSDNVPISEYGVFPVVDVRNDDYICYRFEEKETPWCCFNAAAKRRYDEWPSIMDSVIDNYNMLEGEEVEKEFGEEKERIVAMAKKNKECGHVLIQIAR